MYTLTEVLGKGTYAKVYKAFRNDNPDEFVALKKMNISVADYEQGIPQNIVREIALLRKFSLLSHPNILKLFEVAPDLSDTRHLSITLVLEYLPRSLLQYVENEPNITPQICRCLVNQILQGVDFLHVNGVMHRDIKPENLLVSMDGVLKIADFGLSKYAHVGTFLTTVSVTLWYRPYEVLLGCDYNASADIWSVGMVMCQIFTRLPLIQTQTELQTLRKIFTFLGLPDERLWPEVCSLERKQFEKKDKKGNKLRKEMKIMCPHAFELLMRMLDFDIDKRCSAVEALNHNYFNPSNCNCPFQIPYRPPLKVLEPTETEGRK